MPSGDDVRRLEISRGLETTARRHGPGWEISLSGQIDSEIEPGPILELEADHLVFDLEQVDRITSFGIGEWVALMEEIETGYLGFVGCRPPLVVQFNMVYNFGGDGEIITLFFPYRCAKCGQNFSEHVDLRDRYAQVSSFEVDSHPCPECGAEADFDGIPQTYLEYVNRQGKPTPPEPVEQMLDGGGGRDSQKSEEGEQPFRVKKEIVDELTVLWPSGELDSDVRLDRFAAGLEDPVLIVCSELTRIEPETFRQLDECLEGHPGLARVQSKLLAELYDEPELRERVEPVTMVTEVECQQCGWQSEAEVALATLVDPDRADKPQGCLECFGDVHAKVSEKDRAFFREFEPPEISPTVARYLTHCKEGPESRVQRGDFERVVGSSFGPYELEKKIGAGGMAEIYLAKRQGAGGFERNVVIKRLLLEKSASPNLIRSFKREAELAAQLTHPNIVQVTDFGRTNHFYYIAMEYVDGPDLDEVLGLVDEIGERMPIKFAVFVTARIAEALHTAHTLEDESGNQTPVVHRDVSPDNILISSHGNPQLADFGVAQLATELQQKQNQPVRGKASFLSPEALQPDLGPVDGRSDIFSLGTVLYQALTGEAPFEREGRDQTLKAILLDAPPVPSARRADVPERLDTIVKQSLAKKPDERFQSAREFQNALEELLQEIGIVSERRFGEWIDEIVQKAASDEDQNHSRTAG